MEQTDLLRHTLDTLERLAIPYMLVGSFASSAYGEPRLTRDIDVVLDLASAQVADFCAAFPPGEFYVSEQAVREAVQIQFQFNVLHPATGHKIDFLLPRSDEWGRLQMERRQSVQLLPDRVGVAARPEDVILGKMVYYAEGGSEKHLRDITGILRVSGEAVDRDDIRRWAEKLGLSAIWQAILQRLTSDS